MIKGLFSKSSDDRKTNDIDRDEKIVDDKKLRLRSEELDILKNRVKAGEVEFGKEIIEEQKIVDVPVTHEEVIIERHSVGNEPCDSPINEEESIRIPVSKEVVDVGKHTVVTGEISARKKEVEDTKHVSEALKREEARVYKDGDANIISDIDDKNLR